MAVFFGLFDCIIVLVIVVVADTDFELVAVVVYETVDVVLLELVEDDVIDDVDDGLLESFGLVVPEGDDVYGADTEGEFDAFVDFVAVKVPVLVIVFVTEVFGVGVVVLEFASFAVTVLDADCEPDIVGEKDILIERVTDFVIGTVTVSLMEPVLDMETVDVLLFDWDFVFVGDVLALLVLIPELVSVLVPLVVDECVDDTVDVFVRGAVLLEHGEPLLVFDELIVDVCVCVLTGVFV